MLLLLLLLLLLFLYSQKIGNKFIHSFVLSFIQAGSVWFFSGGFWCKSIMILQFTLRTESRHLTKYVNLRELSIIDGLMNAPLMKKG